MHKMLVSVYSLVAPFFGSVLASDLVTSRVLKTLLEGSAVTALYFCVDLFVCFFSVK